MCFKVPVYELRCGFLGYFFTDSQKKMTDFNVFQEININIAGYTLVFDSWC